MWWGHGGFHPFFLIFPVLFMLLIATRIFFFRRHGCGHGYGHGYGHGFGPGPGHQNGEEAEAILRRRLVNGEIGEEEFVKLRDILRK